MGKRYQMDEPLLLPKEGEHHPIFGALKDFISIPPGVDLTKPADPEWGEICEQNAAHLIETDKPR